MVITKNGRMKAFLVPYDEDEFAALMLQYSPSFRRMTEKAAASKIHVPLNEVKRYLASWEVLPDRAEIQRTNAALSVLQLLLPLQYESG